MPVLQFFLNDVSPITEEFTLSKDALLPDLEVQLLDGSVPVDLTAATVKFSMDTEAGVNKINGIAGSLVDAPRGRVKYEFIGTDTDTEGIFFGQFIVTSSSKDFRIPNNRDQRLRIIIGPRIN